MQRCDRIQEKIILDKIRRTVGDTFGASESKSGLQHILDRFEPTYGFYNRFWLADKDL